VNFSAIFGCDTQFKSELCRNAIAVLTGLGVQ